MRTVIVHASTALDRDRVAAALDDREPVEPFAETVRRLVDEAERS